MNEEETANWASWTLGDDIFDNTLQPHAKALLKSATGRTLVAWHDDFPFSAENGSNSSQQTILDFGDMRLVPRIFDRDARDAMFEDVEQVDVIGGDAWDALCAAGKAGWGRRIVGKDSTGNRIYEPVVPTFRPVGLRVEGVTLYIDEKSATYKHDDGHRTWFRDACGIAFHFERTTLLLEKVAAWSFDWEITLQDTLTPLLRGERAPGALVSERL